MKNRHNRAYARNSSIDFKGVAAAARANAKSLLQEWLPDGRFEGCEYVALNPTRNDRALGSFKINWQTGEWSDFADSNSKGRDLISLFAYINSLDQGQAARQVAEKLGMPARDQKIELIIELRDKWGIHEFMPYHTALHFSEPFGFVARCYVTGGAVGIDPARLAQDICQHLRVNVVHPFLKYDDPKLERSDQLLAACDALIEFFEHDEIEVGVELSPWCLLVPTEDDDDPDIVGPFATGDEAERWQKEHGGRYLKAEIRKMVTPEIETMCCREVEARRQEIRKVKEILRRYFSDLVDDDE
jgi:hypothetical protein